MIEKNNIKRFKNYAFCNGGKLLLSQNLCENRNLTLNFESNIRHQEHQKEQNRRGR